MMQFPEFRIVLYERQCCLEQDRPETCPAPPTDLRPPFILAGTVFLQGQPSQLLQLTRGLKPADITNFCKNTGNRNQAKPLDFQQLGSRWNLVAQCFCLRLT